jgi:hypothetical protein
MVLGANFNFLSFLVPRLTVSVIKSLGLIIAVLEDYRHILKKRTDKINECVNSSSLLEVLPPLILTPTVIYAHTLPGRMSF